MLTRQHNLNSLLATGQIQRWSKTEEITLWPGAIDHALFQ
jgi:hypothetical protein